jgi:hypothetical protein
MAEIKFYANSIPDGNVLIPHSAGSGLGFYGSNFGVAVPVNSQQTSTFVTNADGTNSGVRLNNTAKYLTGNESTSGEVYLNNTSVLNLAHLPNHLCPLNIRFTHDEESVAVQNCKLRIFDRNNIDNPASGVTTWVFEARHPSFVEDQRTLALRSDDFLAGQFYWKEFDSPPPGSTPATVELLFTSSPGVSGTNTSTQDTSDSGVFGWRTRGGPAHRSNRHDWYVALSSEPESIGSKQNYGLYFTVEYL